MKRLILSLTILISATANSNGQTACSYPQGFYGLQGTMGCYDNTTIMNSTQFMLNAFGTNTSQVFGNVANKRFFTLFKTDITNKNIFKMLPGSHNGQMIAVDNILPYDGAYYGDASTWSLVPIQPTGTSKGTINNLLLAQTITLWFNIHTSSTLGGISLAAGTLVTSEQTSCGSGVPTGSPATFVLPNSVISYLNGGNGYTNDVNGLFMLANDRLGGANGSVGILALQDAVSTINQAFNECRILVTTPAPVTSKNPELKAIEGLAGEQITVNVSPNPSNGRFLLSAGTSDLSSPIKVEVVDLSGRLAETIIFYNNSTITIGDKWPPGFYILKFEQDKKRKQLKLIKVSG